MTYDYELGQSDLIPDSGAPCEAEDDLNLCPECDAWKNSFDQYCDDCQQYLDEEEDDES